MGTGTPTMWYVVVTPDRRTNAQSTLQKHIYSPNNTARSRDTYLSPFNRCNRGPTYGVKNCVRARQIPGAGATGSRRWIFREMKDFRFYLLRSFGQTGGGNTNPNDQKHSGFLRGQDGARFHKQSLSKVEARNRVNVKGKGPAGLE